MNQDKPLVYVILGAAGAGRRQVLADLISDGLDDEDCSLVLLSDREAADERDAKLGTVERWSLKDGAIVTEGRIDGENRPTHVFFVTDGRSNPVDQLEAFKPWLEGSGGELGRVLCVVNCKLAEQHHELIAWYEACIHFSDVVLLAKRDGVANKWMSDFKGRFTDQYFPCLFEFVKEGRVKNPPMILEPEARRMSHFFDETDWVTVDGADVESGLDDEDDEEVVGDETNEEIEVVAEVDPYMERRIGGRRMKEIVDVAKVLG